MTDPVAAAPIEARLDRTIRSVLSNDRPGAAPSALRARIEAIPTARPTAVPWALRPAVGLLAGAGIVAVLALLVATRLVPLGEIDTIGGPGFTAPPAFDPNLEGQGILHDVPTTLQWIPAIVILACGSAAAFLVLRWLRGVDRRRRDAIVAAMLAAVAAGSVALTQHPGFEWRGGSYGPVVGCCVVNQTHVASNVDEYYETAGPSGLVGIVVDISNPGPLPIRLEGLVQPLQVNQGVLHWTALALPTDPRTIPSAISGLQPFEPVEVAPGDYLHLYLFGKAGPCAYGPTFALDAPGVAGYMGVDRDLELAYSVLGLERGGIFTLPIAIAEPTREGCTG